MNSSKRQKTGNEDENSEPQPAVNSEPSQDINPDEEEKTEVKPKKREVKQGNFIF